MICSAAVSYTHLVVEGTVVDKIVEQRCLFFIVLLNRRDAALFLYPLERQTCHIDGETWRGVIHGTLISMRFIVQIDRRVFRTVTDEILSDDDDGHTGRSYIFLGAGKDESEIFYIIYFRQEVG